MSVTCTRCEGTGFLNLHQVPEEVRCKAEQAPDIMEGAKIILKWMEENPETDVSICDCCGNMDGWYGELGEHDEKDYGNDGPYAYNGGVPECF